VDEDKRHMGQQNRQAKADRAERLPEGVLPRCLCEEDAKALL